MTYLSFLSWLIAFGPKVPALLALIEQLIDLFSTPATDTDSLQLVAASHDEEALEAQVLSLTTPEGSQALGDGSRLRNLFKFLSDSGLLQILIGLVAKG